MSGSPTNQGLSILIRLKAEWSMEENHFGKELLGLWKSTKEWVELVIIFLRR